MGFDVYITRARTFLKTKDHPIAQQEWDQIVSQDPTLKPSTEDYYDRRSECGGVERFHPVLWTAHPNLPPLWLIDGAIETKSPDTRTMLKMAELAQRLGANLLDEEDGWYTMGKDGVLLRHPPD